MSTYLKGNFETKNQVSYRKDNVQTSLEEKFEKEAKKKLGGSIAFVSKKKVMWDLEEK